MSFPTINAMCANRTKQVALETLDKLATALGCKPGDLIEQTKPKGGRTKGER